MSCFRSRLLEISGEDAREPETRTASECAREHVHMQMNTCSKC